MNAVIDDLFWFEVETLPTHDAVIEWFDEPEPAVVVDGADAPARLLGNQSCALRCATCAAFESGARILYSLFRFVGLLGLLWPSYRHRGGALRYEFRHFRHHNRSV